MAYDVPPPEQCPEPGYYYHYKHDPNGPLNNYAYYIYGVGHHSDDDCRPEESGRPDAYFFEHYACGSERNYTNYCNPELEKMYEQQSIEPDQTKRKQLVWEIDCRPQEDAARPMIFDYRLRTCRSRAVHGITIMVNSLFNGWRFEDAWLGQ
jgi:ABC-type transport system substrate-binding protein